MNPLRRLRLPALLALDLLLLVALAAVVWADNAANRGIAFTPAPEPLPARPELGVNLFSLHLEPDPAAVTRTLELTAAMGARYARMQVPWDDLEIHGRGDFEDRRNLEAVGAVSAWDKYDRIAAAANAAGVELIWRLERPPAWARAAAAATPEFQQGLLEDGNSTGPPDDLADYGAFVTAVVERYDGDGAGDAPGGPVVRHFQIWNEPNLKNEWGWAEPLPEEFVELLRVGATAARAASPEAVILFPGLAPTDGLDQRAPMTELEYLDRVYKAGGAAYFDVMAAQSYGLGQPPDEHRYVFLRGRDSWSWRRPIDTRNDVSRVVLLREVMEANGDAETEVWVTEFGWNSAPDSIPPERRLTWGEPVSEATKGAYLVGQLERARAEWPWMGVMNVWMLRYGGYAEPDPADPTPYFALVTRDWQTLPAYEALSAYAADRPPALSPTRSWPLLWDYGPLLLLAAMAAAGAATLAALFPALDGARARLRAAQARARGAPGPLARLIQPGGLVFIGMLVGAAVAYRGSAQLPITAAGLALFAALALARPDLALLFVPLTVPLYFIPKGLFDARFGIRDTGIYLPIHEVLLLVALAALGARLAWGLIRGEERLPRISGARLWALAPVGLFVAAALWGVAVAEARGPALRELRWLVVEPLLFVGAAAVVAGLWARRGRGDYWLAVTRAWLVGGAVAGLVGVLQFLGLNLAPLFGTKAGFSDDAFLVEGVRRVSSLFGHPNNLGLAMGRYWPVAAALAHLAFWGAASRGEGLRRALPYALAVGLCLGGLLASFSRGAYLGAAVAAVVLGVTLLPAGLWRSRRVLLPLGALAGLAALGALAVVALDIERFNPFGASSGVRVQTWASSLAMLRDHPLGIGLDQFGRLYPQYISPALAGTNEINTAHPHNVLLDVALRMGPLGLAAFAWLLARLFADARRAIARGGDGMRGAAVGPPLLAGVTAATAGGLVHGLVDQLYFWPDLAFAFWLFVALGRAYGAAPREG
ncbi:MAG TPA: O-antigen ligase family protein [Chloroflexaceae bacterium]|nr:O-antigen ligase family protein [Chloroflexaceae bacterium]